MWFTSAGLSACDGGSASPGAAEETREEGAKVDETDDDEADAPRVDAGPRAARDAASGGGKLDTPRSSVDAGARGQSDAAREQTPSPGSADTDAPTAESAAKAGPFQVKTYTEGYPDAPGYADSTIHYPEGAKPPFVAVAIVPGFVSPQSSIQMWGPFFASHGIVAMTIGTNTPSDLPPMREAALWDAIGTLKGENERADSPLKGKLDLARMATMGWSMGGGGTLLAAQHHPELKAVIALCPWNPGHSYAEVKVPTLFLAAQADVLAGGQSQPFYDSIPNDVPKLLWERAGADHWANNDPAQEGGAVGRYGLAWLKVYVAGDERYEALLQGMPPNSSDFRTNLE